MKKQLLRLSNEYFFAHYHVTFDSAETYRELFAKIKNELALSSQGEYEMSQIVLHEEDISLQYTYKLYKSEELDLDDSEIGYKMVKSCRNG